MWVLRETARISWVNFHLTFDPFFFGLSQKLYENLAIFIRAFINTFSAFMACGSSSKSHHVYETGVASMGSLGWSSDCVSSIESTIVRREGLSQVCPVRAFWTVNYFIYSTRTRTIPSALKVSLMEICARN